VELPRVLGFGDVLLLFVVTGISLRWIATAATAGPSAITVCVCAFLFFYLPFVFAVIELSTVFLEEGGLYVWTRHCFGDFAEFLAAWTYWMSNLPYFPAVLYFAASNALYLRQQEWGCLSNNPMF
jgi:amino acid transporter